MAWTTGKPNLSKQKVTDQQVHEALAQCGGIKEQAARVLGVSPRAFRDRLIRMEERGDSINPAIINARSHRAHFKTEIQDGVVLVGTDIHLWPGPLTTSQRAFLYFAEHMEPRPRAIVVNGDVFDGAKISRHPKIGFLEKAPTVKEELEACTGYLDELIRVSPKSATKVWCLGNHDLRYEAYLAAHAPNMEGVDGMHLKDKFPEWHPCWSFWINEGQAGWTEIKHRFKGGQHATYNNTLRSGVNIVTGHLHSLKVYPWTDRNGTRYGVDAGTLADVDGPQFVNYLEGGVTDWRSGFVVLTYRDGKLLWPEVVRKWDEGHVEFRGQLIPV